MVQFLPPEPNTRLPNSNPMTRSSQTNVRELPQSVVIPDDRRILFFSRDRDSYFFLSHFYAAEIVIEGETWPTVEYFFQSRKSLDPEFRDIIRECSSPGMAKQLGSAPEQPQKHSGQSWFRVNGQKGERQKLVRLMARP